MCDCPSAFYNCHCEEEPPYAAKAYQPDMPAVEELLQQ